MEPVFVASQLAFFTFTALLIVYLISQTVKQLRRREQQVAGLLQSTQAISSTLDLDAVLDRLTSSAAQTLDKPGASIRLLEEHGDELVMSASYGLSQTYLEKGPVRPSSSPLDREALLGIPIIIDNTESDPRVQYPRQIVEEGIYSMLVVPILGRSGTLGVLRIYDTVSNGFRLDDVSLATAIAQQGAVAIENALAHDELHRLELDRASYLRLVTHELRAPVAGAQSLLRTLIQGAAGKINETQADILRRIERRLDFFISLVEDMLTLAASKAAAPHEVLEPVDLESALAQEIDRFADEANARGITLRSDITTENTAVIATPDGLSRIFGNLIDNAIKYSLAGGAAEVKVERHGAFVTVEISDDGMGIPDDDLPRIWDEFFRSRKVRRTEIAGTGLGLSIVKELVTRFKGIISVESTEGIGTSFTVTFPVASPSLDNDAAIEQGPPLSSAT
jgi:signal transduction histidine kinase